jgi:hypothetical protein
LPPMLVLNGPPFGYDVFGSADEGSVTMTVGAVTADGRARVLADGNQMPMLGLGVWQVPNGAACVHTVRWALELGYRHIDTAQAYGNEDSVGTALRDSGVPRDEVLITTKFYPGRKDPVAEARQSLRRLGVDHTPTALPRRWRPAVFPTPCRCSPTARTAWAWPGTLARPRSGPRWPPPGSTNRRHRPG